MTTHDADPGGPSGLKNSIAEPPQATEPELDAWGLPVQNRRPTVRTGLIAPGQRRRRVRQVAWALVPIVSLTFLAWWPFLVLALIRRWARDWAVFAAYLAAVVAEIVLFTLGVQGILPTTNAVIITVYALVLLVAITAAVHTLVAFRPGAGVPFKLERFPGLASGHTVDRTGSTHTFASNRGLRGGAAVCFALMAVLVCAVTIAHGPQGGFNAWVKIAFIIGVGGPAAWFAVRVFRLGVKVSSGKMTVRNLWRTRVIAIGEIRRIDLDVKSHYHGDDQLPRIDLTNGDSIWIDGLACRTILNLSDQVAATDELRSLIGLRRQAQVTIKSPLSCKAAPN
jgi:hypothetical protein